MAPALIQNATVTKRIVDQSLRFLKDHGPLCYTLPVCVLATLGTIGYLSHVRLLIELLPSPRIHMTFATCVCLTLTSFGLALDAVRRDFRQGAQIIIGLVLALAVTILLENLLDIGLGLDFPHFHEWLADPVPRPGRTSPNAALALIGIALAFLCANGRPSRRRVYAIKVLLSVAAAIGALGVLGNVLTLDFLYGWAGIARVALPTSVALLGLTLATYEGVRTKDWYRAVSARAHGDQLTLDADLFLIAIAIGTSLVAFSVIESRLERLVSDELGEQLADRASFFSVTLNQIELRTAMVSTRPGVLTQYRRLEADPSDQVALNELGGIARSFLPHGFTALRFLDPGGKKLTGIGELRAAPELRVPLGGTEGAELLWDDGFYLRSTQPIVVDGRRLGSIESEQSMSSLTRLNAATAGWGETAEAGLCATVDDGISCFPGRHSPHPFTLRGVETGVPKAIAMAISGALGVQQTLDKNGARVLVAYRPIGTTGLGLIAQVELAEIYRPIRSGFELILPLLVLLVAAGSFLLRWRMRPVLAQIAASQRAVVESENRFRVASESGLDAFLILDSVRSGDGTIVDFLFSYVNRNAEKLLGQPRDRILNQSLSNTVPMLVSGGWFDRYKKVVDSGRPTDAEHSVEFANFPATWVHQHIVPLGDGIAATVKDISERKKLEHDLRRMAQSDTLTQLPNRALFLDRLERAMIRAQGTQDLLAVLAVDIDRFQDLNRQGGHASGDAVLKEYARRLTEGVRPEDTVARTGGDEFGVLLEGLTSRTQVFSAVEAILASLREEIQLRGRGVKMTASIGIALFSGGGATAVSLIQRADAALADVKQRGPDGYFAAEDLPSQAAQGTRDH